MKECTRSPMERTDRYSTRKYNYSELLITKTNPLRTVNFRLSIASHWGQEDCYMPMCDEEFSESTQRSPLHHDLREFYTLNLEWAMKIELRTGNGNGSWEFVKTRIKQHFINRSVYRNTWCVYCFSRPHLTEQTISCKG